MYYNCLKEYYEKQIKSNEDMRNINYFKACILTMYRKKLEKFRIRSKGRTIIQEEILSMYQIINQTKTRQDQCIGELETKEAKKLTKEKI